MHCGAELQKTALFNDIIKNAPKKLCTQYKHKSQIGTVIVQKKRFFLFLS
jgi:hypothetical protein